MRVELPKLVARRFRRHLRRAGRREIGGVLMAEQLSTGHFRIVDFSADDQTGGTAHFVRSPEQHRSALDEFFAQTGTDYRRFNYLGEWHSHPSFPVLPSVDDCASMTSLVEGERDIHFAVLLIVRLRLWIILECGACLFMRNGSPMPVDLERTDESDE